MILANSRNGLTEKGAPLLARRLGAYALNKEYDAQTPGILMGRNLR